MSFYLFYLLERRQDLSLASPDDDGVLEMGGRFSVPGLDGPTVLIQPDGAVAHCDHRLNGDTHAGFQHHTISPSAIVWHLRILVHLATDAMTGQFAHNTISLCLAVVLHSTADITQMISCHRLLNAKVKRLLSCLEQLFDLVGDLTYAERIARVAIELIQERPAVDRDDVSLFQDCALIRYAMHHDVIHRRTDAGRKRPSIWIREPLERRDGTMISDELVRDLVQLEGRYSRLDMFCQFAKRLTNKLVSLAHQLNLIFSLQVDLHRRLISRHATTVDTAGTEQTVVVAHQQMALDLCECVKNHTDENQQ